MSAHQWQCIAIGGPISVVTTHWCNRCGALCKTTTHTRNEDPAPDIRRTYCAIGGTWTIEEPACAEVPHGR